LITSLSVSDTTLFITNQGLKYVYFSLNIPLAHAGERKGRLQVTFYGRPIPNQVAFISELNLPSELLKMLG